MLHDILCERKRAGEARRFDAEHLHQARQPVLRRGIDEEVGLRLAGAR
jgi:hypothetical protein